MARDASFFERGFVQRDRHAPRMIPDTVIIVVGVLPLAVSCSGPSRSSRPRRSPRASRCGTASASSRSAHAGRPHPGGRPVSSARRIPWHTATGGGEHGRTAGRGLARRARGSTWAAADRHRRRRGERPARPPARARSTPRSSRIDHGTYGLCEVCHDPIEPHAARCRPPGAGVYRPPEPRTSAAPSSATSTSPARSSASCCPSRRSPTASGRSLPLPAGRHGQRRLLRRGAVRARPTATSSSCSATSPARGSRRRC